MWPPFLGLYSDCGVALSEVIVSPFYFRPCNRLVCFKVETKAIQLLWLVLAELAISMSRPETWSEGGLFLGFGDIRWILCARKQIQDETLMCMVLAFVLLSSIGAILPFDFFYRFVSTIHFCLPDSLVLCNQVQVSQLPLSRCYYFFV